MILSSYFLLNPRLCKVELDIPAELKDAEQVPVPSPISATD